MILRKGKVMKVLQQAQGGLLKQVGLLIFVIAGGCSQDLVLTVPEPRPGPQAEPAFSTVRPKPGNIIEFKADSVDARTFFKDFKI